MKRGFTLAEVLVVLAVLSILGLIVLTIFTRSLRGANKTQVILSIKENGQAVLEIIDKDIRNSDNLVCPALPAGQTANTVVISKDGLYTRYRISMPEDNTTAASCAENGCIAFDTPSPTEQETTPLLFINRVCNGIDPMVNPTVLTDTDSEKGVLVQGGEFKLNRKSGFKDFVNVKFTLKPPPGAPSAVAGQIDPVTFETTIQLR